MKKIIYLLFVFVVILGICACGNNKKESLQELQKNAKIIDFNEISNTTVEDLSNAKDLYFDESFQVTGPVFEIKRNYFIIGNQSVGIKVFVDKKDLKKLKNNQDVTVVGKIDNNTRKNRVFDEGFSYTRLLYTMKNAYFVKDTYDVTGMLQKSVFNDEGGYLFESENKKYIVYFSEQQNLDSIEQWNLTHVPITLTGKIIHESDTVYEREIIEAVIKE